MKIFSNKKVVLFLFLTFILFLRPAFASVPYPKIFLHGLNGDCDDWDSMIKSVAGDKPYYTNVTVRGVHSSLTPFSYSVDGYSFYKNDDEDPMPTGVDPDSFWNVDYYYDEDGYYDRPTIDSFDDRLQTMVENIKSATGADKVIIIAHSMGGVVARKYMVLSTENWESVYRILTVGTPNLGVYGILDWYDHCDDLPVIVGEECDDLDDSSAIMHNLYDEWLEMETTYAGTEQAPNRIWGVVGGTDDHHDGNDPTNGDGRVEIWSAVPGEWKIANEDFFDEAAYNTPNYGFRMTFQSEHGALLTDAKTKKAIEWADSTYGQSMPNTPGYTVYRDANYNTGILYDFREYYPLTFTGNEDDYSDMLKDVGWDGWVESDLFQDNITAVSVDSSGLSITFYIHADYLGSSYTLTESISNLTDVSMNDTVSSVLVTLTDEDADGIADYLEDFYDTDFSSPDDDDDGDGASNATEFEERTSPLDADTDDDGFDDGLEIKAGCDPFTDDDCDERDGDEDGMKDYWEVTYGLDPNNSDDATEDADEDGLSNLGEFEAGSNPNLEDTDGDTMTDSYEVENNLDPIDSSDATLDSDGDGLSNLVEYNYGFKAGDSSESLYLLVPYEYSTISLALSAASSGDTIKIASGTYYERLTLSKSVRLLGADEDATVIDGSKKGLVISVSASVTVVLESLTLTHGSATYGGGLRTKGRTYLNHVRFSENSAYYGGGLYADSTGELRVYNSHFSGNSAIGGGGAAYLNNLISSPDFFFQTIFENNKATSNAGGAVYLRSPSQKLFLKNGFSGNSAVNGGAIYQSEGDHVDFIANVFTENTSTITGGAIAFKNVGYDNLYNNSFIGQKVTNTSSGKGGALYFYETGYFEIQNNFFARNSGTHGGAITAYNSGDINYFNNLFLNNSATKYGSVYYGYKSSGLFSSDSIYLSSTSKAALFLSSASLTTEYVNLYGSGFSGATTSTYLKALGVSTCSTCVFGDPLWGLFTNDGDETNDDFSLSSTSPLIDTGSPDSDRLDVDGSRNDIGITGGPDAGDLYPDISSLEDSFSSSFGGEYITDDTDGDGVADGDGDCDDSDSLVHEGVIETVNGKDDDCDGSID